MVLQHSLDSCYMSTWFPCRNTIHTDSYSGLKVSSSLFLIKINTTYNIFSRMTVYIKMRIDKTVILFVIAASYFTTFRILLIPETNQLSQPWVTDWEEHS
jgi:hypothetical protein